MKAIRNILALAAAVAVLGAAGCGTGDGETTSSLSEIEKSFATLVELFKAPEPDLTAYASTKDSFAKNPEAIAFLEDKAKSYDEDERAVCADVLGAIEDKKAVMTLASMIKDDSSKARKHVYVSLQNHNTDEARAALADAMRMHGPDGDLIDVVCEVNDEGLWAATFTSVMDRTQAGVEIALDPEVITALLTAAKEYEFDAAGFDSDEFEQRMAEFAKKMEKLHGDGDVEFDWDDRDDHDDHGDEED